VTAITISTADRKRHNSVDAAPGSLVTASLFDAPPNMLRD